MPDQVRQIIEGTGKPLSITSDEPVSKALSLMIEYDYSQLPVIKTDRDFDMIEGLITYEGILRGIRNFNATLEDLQVRDVMVMPPIVAIDDDLFDAFDRLQTSNAVLVLDMYGPGLVGIVTSYDMADYFRNRTEDFMRVEDVEFIVKEFIKAAYSDQDGEVNTDKLNEAAARMSSHGNPAANLGTKVKAFEDLSLGDYISMLAMKDTWPFFEPIFHVQREFVHNLLSGIRVIRNALAHFRADITADQRDQLKFATDWLRRHQEEYQGKLEADRLKALSEIYKDAVVVHSAPVLQQGPVSADPGLVEPSPSASFSATEASVSGGRMAALAD